MEDQTNDLLGGRSARLQFVPIWQEMNEATVAFLQLPLPNALLSAQMQAILHLISQEGIHI